MGNPWDSYSAHETDIQDFLCIEGMNKRKVGGGNKSCCPALQMGGGIWQLSFVLEYLKVSHLAGLKLCFPSTQLHNPISFSYMQNTE